MNSEPIPCRYYTGLRHHVDRYLMADSRRRIGPVRIITRVDGLLGERPGLLQVVGPIEGSVWKVIDAARDRGWTIEYVDY